MKFAGIDIGTTTISAVLIDGTDGRELKHYTRANDSGLKGLHDYEKLQDAGQITHVCRELLEEILQEAGTSPEGRSDLGGIGLTGQMHGMVYVDADGRAVSPLATWQDGRGGVPLPGTGDSQGACRTACDEIQEKTGWKSATGFGWTTVYADSRMGQIPAKAASICTIEDYVAMQLTGLRKPLMHPSTAASFGLFNADDGKHTDNAGAGDGERPYGFDRKSMEVLNIPLKLIPEVKREECVIGAFSCDGYEIPVAIPIGDNQASFLGSAGPGEDMLVNIGTGSQVSVLSDRFLKIKGLDCRPYIDGKFLINGSSLCGGYAYSILERFYQNVIRMAGLEPPKHLMKQMDEAASLLLPGGSSLRFDTLFNGTREDASLTGCIGSIREENFTPADLSYSCMEGIARELFDFYCLLPDSMKKGGSMAAGGNGPRSSSIERRILERVFGKKLLLTQSTEEAAFGCALNAVHAVTGKSFDEVRKFVRYTQ